MAKAPFKIRVNSNYGAPMGRASDNPSNFYGKVHLRRVPFVDGDYDPGGAYWGGGRGMQPLYCAWQTAGDDRDECVYYFRASNRREAKRQLLELNPEIIFLAYPGESDYH